MITKMLIAAAAALSVAIPATAATPSKGQSAKSGQGGKEAVYCIKYEKLVGSRIEKQDCKTKAEWAKYGVDVGQL